MVVEDEPEDDEGVDVEDRTEKPDTVLPKQADEFRCTNCFLIKKSSQLADPEAPAVPGLRLTYRRRRGARRGHDGDEGADDVAARTS